MSFQKPDIDPPLQSSFDQQPLSPPLNNHGVDYVIVFRFPTKSYTDCIKPEQHVIDGLQTLTMKLTRAQLFFKVQQSEKRGTLLILVGCPDARLYKEHIEEKNHDFLSGISLDGADKEVPLRHEICEADRLRLIHNILVSSEQNGGAGISPHVDPFVKSIVPLHDDNFNKQWIATLSKKWIIGDDYLQEIRNHFGEKVAFYFAFCQFYSQWLMIPAGLGILAYFISNDALSIWYSLSMLVWGIAFTETWKRKQTELSTRWNVLNYSKHERIRTAFKGNTIVADQVPDLEIPIIPAWKTILRRALTLSGVAIGATILVAMVTFMFVIQLFLYEYYTGPFHQHLHYAPTIGYALLIPKMSGSYNKWMRKLTNWEMHQTETSWEYNYTQKIFVANFLVSYLSLLFIAWIHIPFGGLVLPLLNEFDISHDHNEIDFQLLRNQLAYLVMTGQFVSFFTGTVAPQVLLWMNLTTNHISSKLARGPSYKIKNQDTKAVPSTMDHEFIKKINKEADMNEYNVHVGYVEMVIQFGYISMFSPVWPLVAVCCIANNWVKIRSDALKMSKYTRRPTPLRVENTGPWTKNMETIVWLSSITMASFAYLSHPDTNLYSSHLPLYMLLSILLSEHLFAGLRLVIQSVISMIPNWSDSMIKKKSYKMKQNWLHLLDQDRTKSTNLVGIYKQDPLAKFWSEDADIGARSETGIQLIKSHFKLG